MNGGGGVGGERDKVRDKVLCVLVRVWAYVCVHVR